MKKRVILVVIIAILLICSIVLFKLKKENEIIMSDKMYILNKPPVVVEAEELLSQTIADFYEEKYVKKITNENNCKDYIINKSIIEGPNGKIEIKTERNGIYSSDSGETVEIIIKDDGTFIWVDTSTNKNELSIDDIISHKHSEDCYSIISHKHSENCYNSRNSFFLNEFGKN